MIKKDYIVIAAAVKRARDNTRVDLSLWTIDRVVSELCDALWHDNQRFDAERFKEATK